MTDNSLLSTIETEDSETPHTLLKVEGLVKSYQLKRVVDGVSFEVNPGEIVVLLGPNGAGKTTSFRMTVGLIKPNGGSVSFMGEDVTKLPMYKRAQRGMGYLSQEPSIFQRMTVSENIIAILETLNLSSAEMKRRHDELLEELDLTRLSDNVACTLSGGERRRLEITRALVTRPKLLLLDEPFSGVDPIAVADIQQIILQLKERGMGILLTDHSVRETLHVTDRAYLIKDGRIMLHGDPEVILNDDNSRKYYLGENFKM